MLRDNLKDKKYFDEYIDYQIKRINDFKDLKGGLTEQDVQKEKRICLSLANFYKDLISAEYSAGESADDLRQTFEQYLDNIKICGINSYDDTIDTLSLAILLNVSYTEIQPVMQEKYSDDLTEKLLSYFNTNSVDSGEEGLLYSDQYQPFYEYAIGECSLEDFINFMSSNWYNTNKEKAWYGSHLSNNDTYVGYWCWLAAALMKIRGDKASEVPYVPVDLI